MICFSKPDAFSISIFLIPMRKKGPKRIFKNPGKCKKTTFQKCWGTKFPALLWGAVQRLSSAQRRDSSAKSLGERKRPLSQVCTFTHFSSYRPKTNAPQCHMSWRRAKEIAWLSIFTHFVKRVIRGKSYSNSNVSRTIACHTPTNT